MEAEKIAHKVETIENKISEKLDFLNTLKEKVKEKPVTMIGASVLSGIVVGSFLPIKFATELKFAKGLLLSAGVKKLTKFLSDEIPSVAPLVNEIVCGLEKRLTPQKTEDLNPSTVH